MMVIWIVWYLGLIFLLLVICVVLCGLGGVSVVSGVDDGFRFNDYKELEVLLIVFKVEENYVNCCKFNVMFLNFVCLGW